MADNRHQITYGFVVLDLFGESHQHPCFNDENGEPKTFTGNGDVIAQLHDWMREHPEEEGPGKFHISQVIDCNQVASTKPKQKEKAEKKSNSK